MAEQPSYQHRVPIFLHVTCTPWLISSSRGSGASTLVPHDAIVALTSINDSCITTFIYEQC